MTRSFSITDPVLDRVQDPLRAVHLLRVLVHANRAEGIERLEVPGGVAVDDEQVRHEALLHHPEVRLTDELRAVQLRGLQHLERVHPGLEDELHLARVGSVRERLAGAARPNAPVAIGTV
jgi:hypothetical protein